MFLRLSVCLFLLSMALAPAGAEGLLVAPNRYGGFYTAGEKVVLVAQHASGPIEYQVSNAQDAVLSVGEARPDREGSANVTLDSRKLAGWYSVTVRQGGQSAAGSFVVIPRSHDPAPTGPSIFGAIVTLPPDMREMDGMAKSLRLAGVRSVLIAGGSGANSGAFADAALREGLQIAPTGSPVPARGAMQLSPAKAYATQLALSGGQVLYYPWNLGDAASLVTPDGCPRLAAMEYRLAAEQLDGAKFVRKLKLGADLTGFEFLRGDDRFVAAWSDTAGRAAEVKITSSSDLIAVDAFGRIHSVPEDLATVTLHLTNQPVMFHGVDEDFWLEG
ncbi:MAG TPA: hypothetical protein VFJ58_02430 [Armatimonadota bacterium]|nr:hypothetical protein [Armatimonadota bacterium]